MNTIIIIFGLAALFLIFISILLVIYGITTFNQFVSLQNIIENSYSSIRVILKKRHDLIPNLVSLVKTYMQHEQTTLTKIAELRASAGKQSNPNEASSIEGQISGLIGKIMVTAEAYPELKANEQFTDLQHSLSRIEEELSAARRSYNSNVTVFNSMLSMFPSNIIAGFMKLTEKEWFDIPDSETIAPNLAEQFGI